MLFSKHPVFLYKHPVKVNKSQFHSKFKYISKHFKVANKFFKNSKPTTLSTHLFSLKITSFNFVGTPLLITFLLSSFALFVCSTTAAAFGQQQKMICEY